MQNRAFSDLPVRCRGWFKLVYAIDKKVKGLDLFIATYTAWNWKNVEMCASENARRDEQRKKFATAKNMYCSHRRVSISLAVCCLPAAVVMTDEVAT